MNESVAVKCKRKLNKCSSRFCASKRYVCVIIHKEKQSANGLHAYQFFWLSLNYGRNCKGLSSCLLLIWIDWYPPLEIFGPTKPISTTRWSAVLQPTSIMTSHILSCAWSRAEFKTARATLSSTARARLSASHVRIHVNRPAWWMEMDSATTHGRQVSASHCKTCLFYFIYLFILCCCCCCLFIFFFFWKL